MATEVNLVTFVWRPQLIFNYFRENGHSLKAELLSPAGSKRRKKEKQLLDQILVLYFFLFPFYLSIHLSFLFPNLENLAFSSANV